MNKFSAAFGAVVSIEDVSVYKHAYDSQNLISVVQAYFSNYYKICWIKYSNCGQPTYFVILTSYYMRYRAIILTQARATVGKTIIS